MREFADTILAFPTVIFTTLLGIAALYWFFVLVGALDLDLAHGGHEGLLEGGHEAAGAHEAAGHADGGGHAESHGEEHHGPGLGVVIDAFGLAGVPLTVSLSSVILWSWFFTGVAMHGLGRFVAEGVGRWLVGGIVLVGATLLGLGLTRLSVRPLRKLFGSRPAVSVASLVGRVCTITTLRVDQRFGQAEVRDGGAGVLVSVRCREKNNLTRGSKALIYLHDPRAEVFLVMPHDDEGLEDPA